jgi:putative aminopeptidase FrvX
MKENQKEFLIKLLNEPSPSGHEETVQKIWKNETSKFCKNIEKDTHGNLIASLNPGLDKSIMIVGHSDEIGLIVTYINDKGFIYFKPVGGIDPSILSSQRVKIISKNGIVEGAIGKISVHLDVSNPEKKLPKMHEIWIDIGAKDKKDAEKYISMGDPVIFGNDFAQLTGNLAMARCWDNRVGIYVVAEVLRNLSTVKNLKKTVYGVSSTQEETGVWSAKMAAYAKNPTMAIAIDVMPSTDCPGILKEKWGETYVDRGPVITRGVRTSNLISNRLIETANRKKIPYQIEVDHGHTFTDADPISQVKAGIPIGVVSLPTRYLHSSVEVLSLKDVELSIELLTEFIIKDKFDF